MLRSVIPKALQSQINMAEALQTLGFTQEPVTLYCSFRYHRLRLSEISSDKSKSTTERHSKLLNKYRIPRLKAIGLRSLGDVFQKLDYLELSTKVLQLSLNVAKVLRRLKMRVLPCSV